VSDIKILLVEEVWRTIESVMSVLSRTNCTIITTSSGKEALKTIRKEHPHLVVLDFSMHEIPGDEICKKLKSSSHTKSIPVIMLGMLGNEKDKARCFAAGCDEFILKPFDPSELIKKILKYLDLVVREHERIPLNTAVDISIKSKGTLLNISGGGVFVRGDKLFPVGTILNLKFTLPDSMIPLEVEGKVIRVVRKAKERPAINEGMGIKFTNLSVTAKKIIREWTEASSSLKNHDLSPVAIEREESC